MNYTTAPRDAARASIARELSRYYDELAGFDGRPPPRFSLARAIRHAGQEHGLRDGYEREICGSAALLAGVEHDPHRLTIPLQALASRTLTTAGTGGYLVGVATPEPIDVLRPWSVVVEAGITTMPNLQENLGSPRITVGSSAGWLTPGGTIADGTPTLGQASMTPKSAACIVNFSRQLLQQGEATENLVRNQLLRAVGALLDAAFFSGTGADGQPLGLVNTAGVNTATGAAIAHAGILEMRAEVLAAGGREDRLQWVGPPAVQQVLGARERSSGGGRFLWDGDRVLGAPAHATATAPASTLVCGDFSAATLGIWGPAALRVEVNPLQSFNTGGMAARIILLCDFAFPQPAAFSVATSVS